MNPLRASRAQVGVLSGLVTFAIATVTVAALLGQGIQGPTGPGVMPQEDPTETPEPAETATAFDPVDFRVSTYEVFLARDPFEPVVPEPAAAEGGTDGDGGTDNDGDPTTSPTTSPTSSPTTSPTASPTPNPTTTPTTSPTPGPPGDGCTQDGAVVCDGHTVGLTDVFTSSGGAPTAVIQVDNVLYEVTAGETFATNFMVRSIEPPCVTLIFGDDAFTLCEGETVLK